LDRFRRPRPRLQVALSKEFWKDATSAARILVTRGDSRNWRPAVPSCQGGCMQGLRAIHYRGLQLTNSPGDSPTRRGKSFAAKGGRQPDSYNSSAGIPHNGFKSYYCSREDEDNGNRSAHSAYSCCERVGAAYLFHGNIEG
jgi:hypothetical protein